MPREKPLSLLFLGLSVQANSVTNDCLFVDGTMLFENERQECRIEPFSRQRSAFPPQNPENWCEARSTNSGDFGNCGNPESHTLFKPAHPVAGLTSDWRKGDPRKDFSESKRQASASVSG
jgi:hypothetical protein